MSGGIISNTVKLGFPIGSPRPSWVEIAGLLKKLNSNSLDMETVYHMGPERSLYIKYKTEAATQEALRRNKEPLKFQYASGKTVELRMLTAGIDIHYVRVFDIPPEVSDEDLCSTLGMYGKIHRAVREKFPANLGLDHLYTGVRGVYMEIEKDIPSALDVSTWKARVFYDGLREKCFGCQAEGHQKSSCPEARRKEKQMYVKSKQITYAGVVGTGIALTHGTEIIDVDDIIVEEEMLEHHTNTDAAGELESSPRAVTAGNEDIMDEERLKEFDRAAEQFGLGNFRENVAKLSELIEALPDSKKDKASERRAQFASSGSTELRPTKTARRSNK